MAVQASDTTAQLYREIEKVTNGISATLQSESRAEYINNATYDYAIFCDGEIVADVEGDMLLDEMTAETVKDFLQAVMLQAVVRRSMLRALLQRVKLQGFRQLSILTAKKALRKSAMKIQIIISGKPRNISQTAIHSTPRNSLKRQCRRLWTATQAV